jgi:lipoprotein NlpI
MKIRPFSLVVNFLALTFLCSIISAQEDSAQEESPPQTEQQNETALKTAQRENLERVLDRLNDLITDAPSRAHHDRAEVLFRLGRFKESVVDYNKAAVFGRPHDEDSCWERGLAQYYAGDFRDGMEQFARYHHLGPSDIENGLWWFLCKAEDEGIAKARAEMLAYPGKVRGQPFPALLALYLDEGSAESVLEEATRGTMSERQRTYNLFNAHYYLAKYYEIVGQKDEALRHVREALAHKIPHFMYACAEADALRMEAAKTPATTQ